MTPPFAKLLEANREKYNGLFARARRQHPALDPAAFADVLKEIVAPLAAAVDRAAPERLAGAVDALYELALELLGKGLLGPESRSPHVVAAWKTLFPGMPALLAKEPRLLLGALTNAVHNLAELPGARPESFLEEVASLSAIATSAGELLQAGKVVAWRAGAAHYREGALAALEELSPALAGRALALDGALGDEERARAVAGLRGDPWLSPEEAAGSERGREMRIVSEPGGFRGFGGPFLAPPLVRVSDARFLVGDGDGTWLLLADRFGATFHAVGDSSGAPGCRPAFAIDAGGGVTYRGEDGDTETARFPGLASASSSASTTKTLAVTLPLSHHVFLVARSAA